eukprot:TRINITY_DN3215_c0_g1_i1.p1 TRINITY_DN3215_c0_g1~~TRINITY_DN3215_c0_g1_i1.p1  ORF type:complete len:230 (+),score=27.40 TRINITY_DN3215_c0_g1_i1:89-691(+)
MAGTRSHYETLCVEENASLSEIRSHYRDALLTLHPDKNKAKTIPGIYDSSEACKNNDLRGFFPENRDFNELSITNVSSDRELLERFLRVQEAWEVLKDQASREAYDRLVQASGFNGVDVIANEIELEEMDHEEAGEGQGSGLYFYPCRCGDCFSVTESELQTMGYRPEGAEKSKQSEGFFQNRFVILSCMSCSLKTKLIF